jgi:superfamily II DNA or RNA helicase
MYLIFRYLNKKTLIIAPRKLLVNQLHKEFKNYNYPHTIHNIFSGADKQSNCQLVISTWQSIHKMPASWFKQFDVILVDETHRAKAESITNILLKSKNVKYRYGFTGTLDGNKSHKWIIEGLLGPVNVVTTTRELIDDNILPELDIKCILFDYPKEFKMEKFISIKKYPREESGLKSQTS